MLAERRDPLCLDLPMAGSVVNSPLVVARRRVLFWMPALAGGGGEV